ncbi:MAG: ribosome-associated translation inhibitor RaiA [Gammaproteobacteria bacterium]|nr:ribosome-associated translation inhibitor RaiA [Gammaproteobacteria bacterium]
MQNTITGRHMEVTPALKDYVNSKLERLERHHEPPTSTQVILAVEKLNHKAEGIMQISGETICAKAVENDMYAAIDSVADKLDRQLKRHKEQRTQHHATPVSRMTNGDLHGGERKQA